MALFIDMHCHTGWGSGDSHTDPNLLIQQARQFGLHGICITEHNQVWEQRRVEQLADKHNFLVLGGMEVDTDVGHVLVFGVRQPRRFTTFPTIVELRKIVDESGGAMVLAHPFRKLEKPSGNDFSCGRPLEMLERAVILPMFDVVDAVEVHNGLAGGIEKDFAAAVALGRELPTTGGSDTHRHMEVGATFTVFPDGIRTERDLVDAILGGQMRGTDWTREGLPERTPKSVITWGDPALNGGVKP